MKNEAQNSGLLADAVENILSCAFDGKLPLAYELFARLMATSAGADAVSVYVPDNSPNTENFDLRSVFPNNGNAIPESISLNEVKNAIIPMEHIRFNNHENVHAMAHQPLMERQRVRAILRFDFGLVTKWFALVVGSTNSQSTMPDDRIYSDTLDCLLKVEIYQLLRNAITKAITLDDVLRAILAASLSISGAEGADIALWNETPSNRFPIKGLLRIATAGIKASNTEKTNTPVERPSIILSLWNDLLRNAAIIPNVKTRAEYHPRIPGIQSELAIRWQMNNLSLGILNLESLVPNAFNSIDQDVLYSIRGLLTFASDLILHGKSNLISGFGVETASQAIAHDSILAEILTRTCQDYKFGCGVLYLFDEGANKLRIRSVFGANNIPMSPYEFSYRIDEHALSVTVFHKNTALFCLNPDDGKDLAPRGRAFFKIHSTVFGIPLSYGTQVIGVLTLWDPEGYLLTPDKAEVLRGKLTGLSRLLGSLISNFQKQESALLYYSSLLLNLPCPVFCKDEKLHFTFANLAFCEDLGTCYPGNVLGKSDNDFHADKKLVDKYSRDDRTLLCEQHNTIDTLEINEQISVEGQLRSRRLLHVVKKPLRDQNDRVVGIQGLYLEERANSATIENLHEGLYRSTREGRLLYVNKALVNMLGYDSQHELIAKNITRDIYIEVGERQQFVKNMDVFHKVKDRKAQLRRKDGQIITVTENAWEVRDQNEDFVCYEGTMIDITQFESWYNLSMLEALSSKLRHQLRDPIAMIRHTVEPMIKQFNSKAAFSREASIASLRSIDSHAQRLHETLEVFLIPAEATRGSMKGHCVNQLIRKAIKRAKTLPRPKGNRVRIETRLANGKLYARCSPVLLELAFFNLIDNAIQHSDARHVTVSARELDEEIEIVVEDDGRGFGDFTLEMFRVQNAFSSDTWRRSLAGRPVSHHGLLIVREIVSYIHLGRFQIENNRPVGAINVIKLAKCQKT